MVALLLLWGASAFVDVRMVTGVGDWITNRLPALEPDPELAPEQPTLVVTVHGLCRSAWSMARLERTLEAQGYEVLNFGYDSTDALLRDHAAALAEALEARLAQRDGPPPRLAFVGHSMGGLVIRAYLARPDARSAQACAFIATPHRGAVLAELRQDFPPFRWFCGEAAALELRPGDPFVASLPPLAVDRIGVLYGASGRESGWNDEIPGDDDGTVGVAEAQLPGATAVRRFELGHYRISLDADVLAAVRRFLRKGDLVVGD